MAEEGFKRKLTAILSADAVGYSRLMAEDEASTVKTMASYREIMSSLITQHRGRVVDSPGDNVLAEFSSVVDAVQCAVAVQNEFQTRNAELPKNRRMEFRIGINLGDVIDEEDRLYGDGVNIAARLESLADSGGICVSKTAFDQIETKLPLGYEYLGEQSVKNIPKPVGAYRVLMKPEAAGKVIGEKRFLGRFSRRTAMTAIVVLLVVAGGLVGWNIYLQQSKKVEPASVDKMAFPLPEKPSIAVLPFDNMGSESNAELFSDGLVENIIALLSKYHNLFVISRESTFTYKGKDVKVQQVAEDLGVRYVLEGSVQLAGNRLRVTAQIIDAITGRHLWADRYDRELKDIFTIQDEITRNIITELAVTLIEGEHERGLFETQNFEAWTNYRKALEQFRRFTKDANLQARKISEKAIELDPKYSAAYSLLGWTYTWPVRHGLSESPKEDLKRAEELVNQAKAINPDNWDAHNLQSFIFMLRGQYDRAIEEGERVIEMAPNASDPHALLSFSLLFADRPNEAVVAVKKAMRLAPFYPRWYLQILGQAYFLAGAYEEAETAFKQFVKVRPEHIRAFAWLGVIYYHTGREKLARAQIEKAMSIKPTFSSEEWRKSFTPWKNREEVERILDIAHKAGLPKKPPQKASN